MVCSCIIEECEIMEINDGKVRKLNEKILASHWYRLIQKRCLKHQAMIVILVFLNGLQNF